MYVCLSSSVLTFSFFFFVCVGSNELGKRVSYNFTIASGGSLAAPTSAVDSIAGLDQFGEACAWLCLSTKSSSSFVS